MSVAAQFIRAFDSTQPDHVQWLVRMITLAESLGPDQRINLVAEINKNPLGVSLGHKDALEWPQIHMGLCAVYAKSVLKKQAYIP